MRRKPIQIVVVPPVVLGKEGVTWPYLFALCSDGSIWRLADPAQDLELPKAPEWELVEPDIPQPH